MEMLQVFEKEYVYVSYCKEHKLLKIEWRGKITSEQYRSTFQKAIEFAHSNLVELFLSDIRNQQLVSTIDRKWFEEEMLPQAIEAGLLRGASILSGGVFKKYYLNNIRKMTTAKSLPFKFFSEEQSAIEWLLANDL